MAQMKGVVGVAFTTSVLLSAVAFGFSSLTVFLAGGMVVLSIINATPWISDEQQRYVIPTLAILLIFVSLPRFISDPVALGPITGGVIGLTMVVIVGPEVRWYGIGIFGVGLVSGAAIAILVGRVLTASGILTIGVVGFITARHCWRSTSSD